MSGGVYMRIDSGRSVKIGRWGGLLCPRCPVRDLDRVGF